MCVNTFLRASKRCLVHLCHYFKVKILGKLSSKCNFAFRGGGGLLWRWWFAVVDYFV